jgi:hypothetical protein
MQAEAARPAGPAFPRTRVRLERRQLARYAGACCALVALVCFYQPWVSASLPNGGESVLTGIELARGEAGRRAGEAGARSGLAGTRGLALPTRMPTAAAGSLTLPTPVAGTAPGGAGAGSLTLPTRIPTVAPGAPAAGAGADQSDLTLPTRQPAGAAIATQAAATAQAIQTAQAGASITGAGAAIIEERPDQLPQTLLYGVPLAAIGIAVFSLLWGHLREARDRLFCQLWTILLSTGGAAGAGYVLAKVATAPRPNDLLGPGEVRGAQWGLWATLVAFLLAALCLAVAWRRPRRAMT